MHFWSLGSCILRQLRSPVHSMLLLSSLALFHLIHCPFRFASLKCQRWSALLDTKKHPSMNKRKHRMKNIRQYPGGFRSLQVHNMKETTNIAKQKLLQHGASWSLLQMENWVSWCDLLLKLNWKVYIYFLICCYGSCGFDSSRPTKYLHTLFLLIRRSLLTACLQCGNFYSGAASNTTWVTWEIPQVLEMSPQYIIVGISNRL